MYLLHPVDYMDVALTATQVQNAWTAAGLPQPVPTFDSLNIVSPSDLKRLVDRTLLAGGAMASGADGAMEVPRSSGDLLRRLEDFYHRLYPQTRASRHRGHFQYEEVEWLGEF